LRFGTPAQPLGSIAKECIMWDIAEQQEKLPVYWPDQGVSGGLFTPDPECRYWLGQPHAGVTETLYHVPHTAPEGRYMLAVRYGPPREEPAQGIGEDGEGFQFMDDYAVRMSRPEAARWFERNGYDLPDDLASLATTPAHPSEEWSAPMSKDEIARRVTRNPSARFREVQTFIEEHGLRQVSERKWQVRLDQMDQRNRDNLERP
jgi:hypothetical protein